MVHIYSKNISKAYISISSKQLFALMFCQQSCLHCMCDIRLQYELSVVPICLWEVTGYILTS